MLNQNPEQIARDHIDKEDFDLDPFNRNGGLGKFYQLFKGDY
jgi:type I restriction enzyme, R subunit